MATPERPQCNISCLQGVLLRARFASGVRKDGEMVYRPANNPFLRQDKEKLDGM